MILWTIIIYMIVFGIAGFIFYFRFIRLKHAPLIVLLYASVGLFNGAASGAIVGLAMGAIYNTGYMSMPTWIPMAWGFIQIAVLLIGSTVEGRVSTYLI